MLEFKQHKGKYYTDFCKYKYFTIYYIGYSFNVSDKFQLRDCELGAIVNRDLSRRIRTVNGITCHKQIVRNDIKLSAKIVHNLDNRSGLWVEDKKAALAEEEAKKEQSANDIEQAVSN